MLKGTIMPGLDGYPDQVYQYEMGRKVGFSGAVLWQKAQEDSSVDTNGATIPAVCS